LRGYEFPGELTIPVAATTVDGSTDLQFLGEQEPAH
jgi:hypothetical protein